MVEFVTMCSVRVYKCKLFHHLQLYEDGPHVTGVGEYPCSVWHPLKSTVVYFVAW